MKRHDAMSEDGLMDTLFWAELRGVRNIEIKTIGEWLEKDGSKIDPHRSTDHLSDREPYEYLVHPDRLGAHTALLHDSFAFLDVIGGGNEEDNQIYLRFYATDGDRARWKEDFPEDELPPRERLPYDRDRFLLQAPYQHEHWYDHQHGPHEEDHRRGRRRPPRERAESGP